jgi:pyruvate-formate lyase-activating enzyme
LIDSVESNECGHVDIYSVIFTLFLLGCYFNCL